MPSETIVQDDGTVLLRSSAEFSVAGAAPTSETVSIVVNPALPVNTAMGRLVHPTLGAFDYTVKPDEWVNIDADAVIAPIWASTRTMGGAVNVLWQGYLRDTVVEERWKSLGGLAMPISMLRMLLLMWTNPVDPEDGYVEWYPNYVSAVGFRVIFVNLSVGGQGIALDDVIHANQGSSWGEGWVTNPVTVTLKIVDRL